MASKKLSELSMEELHNRIQQTKTISRVILVLAILYGIFMIYQMFAGTFETKIPQIAIPVAIVFISTSNSKTLKNIKAEIANRQDA